MRRGGVAWLLVMLAAGGCAKETKGGAKSGSASTSVGSGTGTGTGTGSSVVDAAGVVSVMPEECVAIGGELLGVVSKAMRAMEGQGKSAVEAWKGLRADCRGGAWYLAGALLLHEGVPGPLAVDGVTLGEARAAIDQGLVVAPGDLGLLAYAAYLQGLDDAALPADACDRVSALAVPAGKTAVVREHTDRVAYVCGAAARAAKSWADAIARYAAVVDPPYPDLGVRRVEALVGAGRGKEAGALVEDARAMIERYASRLGVADADVAELSGQLAAAR